MKIQYHFTKFEKPSKNCLQKFTIVVSILKMGIGFAEDHENLPSNPIHQIIQKSHVKNGNF